VGKVITTEMIISDIAIRELIIEINSSLIDGNDDIFIEKEKANNKIRYFAKQKSNYKSKRKK
jgi:hypothetical protein